MAESKTLFGLIIYDDGTIKNAFNGNKVGFVSQSGELAVYVPDKKKVYKISIVILAAFRNNGLLPDKPKTWKVIYKDGDNMNCSLSNLDYIDTTKDFYKLTKNGLKERIKDLKSKKRELRKELDKVEEEILKYTAQLASQSRNTKYEKVAEIREEFNSKKVPSENFKNKPNFKKGRPLGSVSVYLVDKYAQDYELIKPEDASKKLGIAESSVKLHASRSEVVPINPRYALTRSLGNIWELMRRF